MVKKIKPSEEELSAFYKAVAGTKPLHQKQERVSVVTKKQPLAIRPLASDQSLRLKENEAIDDVSSEEFISFKQPDISNKILRKLRKGQYNVTAILDLHGMSIEKAKIAVEQFLLQCLHKGKRVVLIIHGKGHHSKAPILKNKINHWLRELNVVLAFCSAAPSHGSRGAIYVLLKDTTGETFLE